MMSQAEGVRDGPRQSYVAAVRYGFLGWVGEFRHDQSLKLNSWSRVVIKTERGIEIGMPVAFSCPDARARHVSVELIQAYVRNSGEDYLHRNAGEIIRVATPEDLAEQVRIDQQAKAKLAFCETAAAKLGLEMRLIACEHLLGGERIIFYFTADGRIDFRQLVRELAREYHTRIEMRQIGARDEARIVADFEICGRECCCKNFLKMLRPVNMRMAKVQKATLDPTKVSGRCGRLRCCLRYEQQTYEQLDARLPRVGQRVRIDKGVGVICERQIITQILVLDMGEGRRIAVPFEEVREVQPAGESPEPAMVAGPGPAEDLGDLPLAGKPGAGDDEATLLQDTQRPDAGRQAGAADGNGKAPRQSDRPGANGQSSRPRSGGRRGRRGGGPRRPKSG